MTTIRPEASLAISIPPDDVEFLDVTEGKITMDDGWTPYVQATIDVPLTAVELVEQIDPRTDQRVLLAAGDGGMERGFYLGLRKRTVDHKGKKITLELASDEALLIDKRRLADTVDDTPRQHETSLRAICNWALGKIGAALEPGTDDADLTAYWDARNMITDPGTAATAQPVTTGWSTVNCSVDFNDTSWSISGDGDSYNIWSPTAADSGLMLGGGADFPFGMQPGKTYVFSGTGNVKTALSGTNHAGGRVRRLVVFIMKAGETTYTELMSPQVPNTVNTPTRVSVEFTIPKSATKVILRTYLGNTAGQIRWDGLRLSERGPGTVADDAVYFDGDTTDTPHYIYAWEGLQDVSPSTRTAVVERSPALFNWKPGVALWDFLQPLLEASGMRLFCDEERKWRLVNPETYEVPGYVLVQERHNATEGEDTIDRNEEGLWADGVVCVWQWTDLDGIQHEEYDYAGTDGKVATFTYQREFPGPGAAAYLLARLQGRGRTQDVTAFTKYTATPGQDVTINLPGTLAQTGKVRQVIFDLRTGLMQLGTRGLTDALPGSWATWDPEQVWSDVDPGMTWDDA